MRTSQKVLSAASIGLSAALLVGGAPALAQDGDDVAGVAAESLLEGEGYEGVFCLLPTLEGDEALVPAAPDSQAWLVGFVTADVGEATPYSDLTRDFEAGDRLSIVNGDQARQTLSEVVLCAVPSDQVGTVADDLEGNMGERGYSIVANAEASDEPTQEPVDEPVKESKQNPVVETDVPEQSSGDLALSVGAAGLVTGAGALLWSRKHRAAQR